MKKIVSAFLIMLSVFYLVGCSSSEEEENQGTQQTQENEVVLSVDKMPEFTTKNMEGEEVTNDIFSQADLTVVNFWGTYCGPCINEMEELEEWTKKMPDNVRLVGIMVDVLSAESEQYGFAEEIIEETGVTYENLMLTSDFDEIMEQLIGVPTTIFVDSEGNIVADPIVGANVVGYKEFVEEYFDEK